VITPLIIGIATGKAEYGTYAALGALPAGFVAFRGVTRTRVLAVLAAATGMAISTFVGAVTADGAPWLLFVVIFAWAYAIGLLAALGPTVLVVSLQWPVALLIASAIPLDPAAAGLRAGLVLAGGLWQCALVIGSWTVNRGSVERAGLADTFAELAAYAAHVAAGEPGPPAPGQLAASRVLADPNPLLRTATRQHLQDLVQEAERIRATLTALGVGRAAGDQAQDPSALLACAAAVLRDLADGLRGRTAELADRAVAARARLRGMSAEAGTGWQWAGDALLGQLRSACRIAERLSTLEQHADTTSIPPVLRPHQVRDAWLTLQASAGRSSEAGRHALRLAVVTALAEIIVRASGIGHGYWAVLTIFIVLRPDYSSTLQRGLQRAAGTVAGAGLGVCTVLLGRIGPAALLAGIGVSLLAAYAVFTVNYVLYAVFLTDFVVVLLDLLGLPPGSTAIQRIIGTGIGTGLAMLAYVFWPTWEGTSAAEKFARLAEAQGAYAAALLRAYTRPGVTGRLRGLQLAARRARTDAVASADRLAGEPEHAPMRSVTAGELAAAGHRIAQATLTLSAVVGTHHAAASRAATKHGAEAELQADLDKLAAGVETAAGQIAAALRALGQGQGRRAVTAQLRLPPLRAQQQAVWRDVSGTVPAHAGPADTGPAGTTPADTGPAGTTPADSGPAGTTPADSGPADTLSAPDNEEAGLLAATDALVDAINTEAFILRE
jgi:uncharacterized membrane protein YccC